MLSGHGLVSSITGSSTPPLTAYRIVSPSIVRCCGSIALVCEEVMTSLLSRVWRWSWIPPGQPGEDRAHDGAVQKVRGQVFTERSCVVLPDRLVDLRQREHDVAG